MQVNRDILLPPTRMGCREEYPFVLPHALYLSRLYWDPLKCRRIDGEMLERVPALVRWGTTRRRTTSTMTTTKRIDGEILEWVPLPPSRSIAQLWSGVQATCRPKTSAPPSHISAKGTIKLCSQSQIAEKGENCFRPICISN